MQLKRAKTELIKNGADVHAIDNMGFSVLQHAQMNRDDSTVRVIRYAMDGGAGFFTGVYHGLFFPLRLSIWLFSEIGLYADINTGTGYLIGFCIGLLAFLIYTIAELVKGSLR